MKQIQHYITTYYHISINADIPYANSAFIAVEEETALPKDFDINNEELLVATAVAQWDKHIECALSSVKISAYEARFTTVDWDHTKNTEFNSIVVRPKDNELHLLEWDSTDTLLRLQVFNKAGKRKKSDANFRKTPAPLIKQFLKHIKP